MTFTKLFSSITESTVWMEPDHVRLVWITMLAMADRQGRVYASVPGLAHRARVEIEQTEDALGRFLSPDPHSRTPEFEGRRIEEIDGGWRLLNYAKYRAVRDEEAAKESKRKYAARRREDEKPEAVEKPKPSAQAERSKVLAAELKWRVSECWRVFLLNHDDFYRHENGKAAPHPSMTPEIEKSIREAILTHDKEWLLPEQREEWNEKSWARAAGIGLFLDEWNTASKDGNRYEEGGTRYLEAWRPWKRQRGKPDPVERFARLHFETREGTL